MNDNGFDWDAKLYNDSSRMQYQLGEMTIERLDPSPGERILEIGSGNAMLSIEIAKRIQDGRLVGMEISPEQCAQARRNIDERGISNAEIYCMDALKMDHENKFDAVFSNSAIHWINDLEGIYRKIYRALQPGGRIMIQTGLKERNELFMVVFKIIKEFREYLEDFELPWRFLTERQNNRILEKTGFIKIKVKPYHIE